MGGRGEDVGHDSWEESNIVGVAGGNGASEGLTTLGTTGVMSAVVSGGLALETIALEGSTAGTMADVSTLGTTLEGSTPAAGSGGLMSMPRGSNRPESNVGELVSALVVLGSAGYGVVVTGKTAAAVGVIEDVTGLNRGWIIGVGDNVDKVCVFPNMEGATDG